MKSPQPYIMCLTTTKVPFQDNPATPLQGTNPRKLLPWLFKELWQGFHCCQTPMFTAGLRHTDGSAMLSNGLLSTSKYVVFWKGCQVWTTQIEVIRGFRALSTHQESTNSKWLTPGFSASLRNIPSYHPQ